MAKTPRLSPSGIEYLTHVWNFYSGCRNWQNGICRVGVNCWALKRTERFKQLYPNGFEPTFYPKAFKSPLYRQKPSRIGVAFMGDLFGDWIDPDKQAFSNPHFSSHYLYSLKEIITHTIKMCSQHTFVFLTKCHWNLKLWTPFPQNCFVGVTVTSSEEYQPAYNSLISIDARVKFISFEPLLTEIQPTGAYDFRGIQWIIIGAQTQPFKAPRVEWIENLVWAAAKTKTPVFLKDNLVDVLPPTMPFYKPPDLTTPAKGKIELIYRQEIPNGLPRMSKLERETKAPDL